MKFITTIVLGLLSLSTLAQSDTSLYHYRFSIKDVTNKGSANLIQEPLVNLFKVKPKYEEAISTFVFESNEDVERTDVYISLMETGFSEVTYFKKERIK